MYSNNESAELLSGLAGPDDGAVIKLDEDRALIMTTDFFPPVVDDPYEYGAIAAANALSDVYAMGGEPLLAINLVGWPDDLDTSVLGEIMRGGADKVVEAGACIAGGHTVSDSEPKYGLAVAGLANPGRIFRKGGIVSGDKLVITKPIGSGIITTASKEGEAEELHVERCLEIMSSLNGPAMRAAQELHPRINAATDVSGFGLLGHANEMAAQSGCGLIIDSKRVPWMDGAEIYAEAGKFSGGAIRNYDYFTKWIRFKKGLNKWQRLLMLDPQTSGGLMFSVDGDYVFEFIDRLEDRSVSGWIVGEAVAGGGGEIRVI